MELHDWKRHLDDALAPSTKRSYELAWRKWREWCDIAREVDSSVDPFTPSLEVICTFIQYHRIFKKESTVKKYLVRANTVSKDKGGKGLIKDEWTRIINRTYMAAAKRHKDMFSKRLPLTLDILTRIKPLLDPKSHNDRAFWAILCVGIFTLARIGELLPSPRANLKLQRKALVVRGDEGSLELHGTKMDRERRGVTLAFFRNKTICCPVTAMNAYISGSIGHKPNSPLFLDDKKRPITQSTLVQRMRELLNLIGLEGKDYSGISLRRGGAQILQRLGASDRIIMGMGRWKSVCFRRYPCNYQCLASLS